MLNKAVVCHRLKNVTDGVRIACGFLADNTEEFFAFFMPDAKCRMSIRDVLASQTGIVVFFQAGRRRGKIDVQMGAFAEWVIRVNSPMLLRETLEDIKRRNPEKIEDPEKYILGLSTAGLLKWSAVRIGHGDGRNIHSNGCGMTYKDRIRAMDKIRRERGIGG